MNNKVISKDGTTIAYDVRGSGPAVILIDGALGYRGFGSMSQLAELLASRFTAYNYDRRGRGESSNSKPSSVEREVEDVAALIKAAGGTAHLFGISSGACLALETTVKLGDRVGKLAIYEAAYNSDKKAAADWRAYTKQLAHLLDEGRRGEALVTFLKFVGTPQAQIDGMRQAPMWPMLEAEAPTLLNDVDAMGEDRTPPLARAAKVRVPTLVMDGGANLTSRPWMHETAQALAKAIPNARQVTLEGQRHDVNMQVLAPVLTEFLVQRG